MDESRFIGQLINVEYDQPPLPEKKTTCPNRFSWQVTPFKIKKMLGDWHDYRGRGLVLLGVYVGTLMAPNEKPSPEEEDIQVRPGVPSCS